jgi:hypothetical protein
MRQFLSGFTDRPDEKGTERLKTARPSPDTAFASPIAPMRRGLKVKSSPDRAYWLYLTLPLHRIAPMRRGLKGTDALYARTTLARSASPIAPMRRGLKVD